MALVVDEHDAFPAEALDATHATACRQHALQACSLLGIFTSSFTELLLCLNTCSSLQMSLSLLMLPQTGCVLETLVTHDTFMLGDARGNTGVLFARVVFQSLLRLQRHLAHWALDDQRRRRRPDHRCSHRQYSNISGGLCDFRALSAQIVMTCLSDGRGFLPITSKDQDESPSPVFAARCPTPLSDWLVGLPRCPGLASRSHAHIVESPVSHPR